MLFSWCTYTVLVIDLRVVIQEQTESRFVPSSCCPVQSFTIHLDTRINVVYHMLGSDQLVNLRSTGAVEVTMRQVPHLVSGLHVHALLDQLLKFVRVVFLCSVVELLL